MKFVCLGERRFLVWRASGPAAGQRQGSARKHRRNAPGKRCENSIPKASHGASPHFIGRRTSAKGSQFFHRRLTVIVYLIFHARSSTEVSTPAHLADGTNAARHSFPKSPTNRCAGHRRC